MTDRFAARVDQGLRFVARCGTATDVASLIDAFFNIAETFGFNAGAGGGWTGVGRNRAYRFYFNTWPADWMAIYNARQIFFEDPMVLEAQRRMTPFLWRELEQRRSVDDPGREILALAFEYGWADGLVVPIHGPAGYQGLVSLATRRPLDLAAEEVSLLWIMALALHERCREAPAIGISSTPPPRLTARQIECMRWVASGKTDWEIAQLLKISPATVHFHVERVKRQLAVATRTQAVALLVLHGTL